MPEKSLGQVAWEALGGINDWWQTTAQFVRDDYEKMADAVVAEYEARRWRPIEEFGEADVDCTLGRWKDGTWETCAGWFYLPYREAEGWTHVYVPGEKLPAPPKEASDAGK